MINLPRTSSPYPLNITQGTLIRNAKKFWNAKGETAWYESASSEARTSLPLISTLPELRDGDIFLHKISPIAGDSPTTHQLWLRSNGSWLPIEPGHNLTDINGRDRTLVMTSDSEPSWVLRSTARRNYNPKKKTRALNKVSATFLGLTTTYLEFYIMCRNNLAGDKTRCKTVFMIITKYIF